MGVGKLELYLGQEERGQFPIIEPQSPLVTKTKFGLLSSSQSEVWGPFLGSVGSKLFLQQNKM